MPIIGPGNCSDDKGSGGGDDRVWSLLRLFYPAFFAGQCPDFLTAGVLEALRQIAQNPRIERVFMLLRLFFQEYFDCTHAEFISPEILIALAEIASGARPICLSEEQQDLAEAWYLAYLLSLRARKQTFSGPITSEREGDIAVTYGNSGSLSSSTGISKRPSDDPWTQWEAMWSRCARGAIITRFGDPVRWRRRSALEIDALLAVRAHTLFSTWMTSSDVI